MMTDNKAISRKRPNTQTDEGNSPKKVKKATDVITTNSQDKHYLPSPYATRDIESLQKPVEPPALSVSATDNSSIELRNIVSPVPNDFGKNSLPRSESTQLRAKMRQIAYAMEKTEVEKSKPSKEVKLDAAETEKDEAKVDNVNNKTEEVAEVTHIAEKSVHKPKGVTSMKSLLFTFFSVLAFGVIFPSWLKVQHMKEIEHIKSTYSASIDAMRAQSERELEALKDEHIRETKRILAGDALAEAQDAVENESTLRMAAEITAKHALQENTDLKAELEELIVQQKVTETKLSKSDNRCTELEHQISKQSDLITQLREHAAEKTEKVEEEIEELETEIAILKSQIKAYEAGKVKAKEIHSMFQRKVQEQGTLIHQLRRQVSNNTGTSRSNPARSNARRR